MEACPQGAQILLTVPADKALWGRHDEIYGHYRRYARAEFERLWVGLPVMPRLVSHFNTRLYPVMKIVRALRSRARRPTGEAVPDLRLPPGPINRLLANLFAGEARTLLRQLRGDRAPVTRAAPAWLRCYAASDRLRWRYGLLAKDWPHGGRHHRRTVLQ